VSGVGRRKLEHLELCIGGDVEARRGTLLDEVELLHEALPELAWAEVDCSVELLGRQLQAPFVISGMTGGAPETRAVNLALAAVAQKHGFAIGVGSQRAMLLDPALADTYRMREAAPDVLLLANLGAVQAREAGPERVAELVRAIGADAVCIHLNAAQELVQDEGDRDFRGLYATLAELVQELAVPVVVKETGCGLAPRTLARLRAAGVRWVDVAGAGGTSWTGVESLRGSPRQRALGALLRDWGVPTAASLVYAERAGLAAIASGGVRDALDAARALALGARAVGLALPFLRAWAAGGEPAVHEVAERLGEGLRAVMTLTGARRVAELRTVPRVLGPRLARWLAADGATPEAAADRSPASGQRSPGVGGPGI
jgi:isopentenyl-diphosphate delta-isomerase